MILQTYRTVREDTLATRGEGSRPLLLFIHGGGLYQALEDDARTVSRVMGLPLTHRLYDGEEVDAVAFPDFSESALPMFIGLIRAGFSIGVFQLGEDGTVVHKKGGR